MSIQILKALFRTHGITISDEKLKVFEQFYILFCQYNSKINLSAIRDREGIWKKHFLDSLLITKFFDLSGNRILDLGSGGGFPALPLSIFYQDIEMVALDSVGKKMKVVQEMADRLNLRLKTIHNRIEMAGQDKRFREQFDTVIARALAPWPVLLEYGLPFVKKGGRFIAYQGPSIKKELLEYKGLEKCLGGEIEDVFSDKIEDMERVFVSVKKIQLCSKKFPRSNGKPRSIPLE